MHKFSVLHKVQSINKKLFAKYFFEKWNQFVDLD